MTLNKKIWTRKRLIAAFAAPLALVAAILVATPAHGVMWIWGMNNANYTVKNPGFNSTWMTPITSARNYWNNNCGPCNVQWNSGASATIAVINTNENIYGRYISYGNYNFKIELNQPVISTMSPFSTSLHSTMSHEMGHSFKLGDYPVGGNMGNRSVMSYERNRMTVYNPTLLDLDEVEDYY